VVRFEQVNTELPALLASQQRMIVCTALLDDDRCGGGAQRARLHTVCPHAARERRVRASVLLEVAIG
jgi:hypothetical protein